MIDDVVEVDARGCRRIGLVSDSHGPVDPRIIDAIRSCDFLIHAGDLGGTAALDNLLAVARVTAVRGNNDTAERWSDLELNELRKLPEVVRVSLTGGSVVVIHGDQFPQAKKRHRQLRDRFPEAMAIIYGHSHRLAMDVESSPWVLNPGACGRARTFGGPSGLILERVLPRWEVSSVRFAPAL
jgi:putative phosphoesterase